MNNNSYVIISADKLEAIFLNCCPPPIVYTRENGCFGAAEDCLKCWKDWLKDGE